MTSEQIECVSRVFIEVNRLFQLGHLSEDHGTEWEDGEAFLKRAVVESGHKCITKSGSFPDLVIAESGVAWEFKLKDSALNKAGILTSFSGHSNLNSHIPSSEWDGKVVFYTFANIVKHKVHTVCMTHGDYFLYVHETEEITNSVARYKASAPDFGLGGRLGHNRNIVYRPRGMLETWSPQHDFHVLQGRCTLLLPTNVKCDLEEIVDAIDPTYKMRAYQVRSDDVRV